MATTERTKLNSLYRQWAPGTPLTSEDLAALGIPSQADYLAHYYQHSGRRDGVTGFHFAFALFRLAVIFEGIAARAADGSAVADNAAEVGQLGRAFAARAVEFVDGRQPSAQ